MIEFRKDVGYVGLADVVGGRVWFCVMPDGATSAIFWTKKECEQFIRKTFSGEDKRQLLKRLKDVKGRAFRYA